MHFTDRTDAGKRMADALRRYRDQEVVVYGLTRGGVVPAAEIARALHAPLDILIPRKIGHPYNPEYAIGAVAEDGHLVLDEQACRGVDPAWLERQIERERAEARRRRDLYLQGRPPVPVQGKTAIVVDDGVATGLTLRLAIQEVKHRQPKRIVVAVPVAPPDTAARIRAEVDELVALDIPERFLGAVGAYYDAFWPVEDAEVVRLLREAGPPRAASQEEGAEHLLPTG